jgi:hypothetical protein
MLIHHRVRTSTVLLSVMFLLTLITSPSATGTP